MRRLVITALVAAVSAGTLQAQGALSVQGFGYPTGQLSARAAGTAGALGEVDPTSTINPASLLSAGRSIFAFQIEPEYRSVGVGGQHVNTTTTRFPLFTVGARVMTKGFIGASFSTLLDRTWEASYDDSVRVAGDLVRSKVSTSVRGAIDDARLSLGWNFNEKWSVGAAFHAMTGANRMTLARSFTDSTTFGSLSQNTVLSYAGTAASFGVLATLVPHLTFGASLRLGGAMSARYGDSVATHAHVPNRYGASFAYDGIPGSIIAVRYDREAWSRLGSLGSSSLTVNDATDLSAGLDVAGPKFQGANVQFRLGARTRELPFGWNGNTVKESSLALGTGIPLARGWATVDVGLQRALRKAGGVSEHGTILSVGLTVRP